MKTDTTTSPAVHDKRNKGKRIGQKPPLKLHEIWTVRTPLRMAGKTRELALFNLAIDSRLRGFDLVSQRVRDITHGNHVVSRASVVQHKTQEPMRFELTEHTRQAVEDWINKAALSPQTFSSPVDRAARHTCPRVSTRASRSGGSS